MCVCNNKRSKDSWPLCAIGNWRTHSCTVMEMIKWPVRFALNTANSVEDGLRYLCCCCWWLHLVISVFLLAGRPAVLFTSAHSLRTMTDYLLCLDADAGGYGSWRPNCVAECLHWYQAAAFLNGRIIKNACRMTNSYNRRNVYILVHMIVLRVVYRFVFEVVHIFEKVRIRIHPFELLLK